MESSRRQQAQADLGMDFAKEDQKRKAALAKEQARADKKAAKREKMMNMPSYRLMVGTAKYMDKWFLDPILGFILPAGIGDALSSVFAFPFIYYSLCVVKSIPLTLAVIFNILLTSSMRHPNYYSLSVRSKSGFTARCFSVRKRVLVK